jgi:peptidyl-prolyl cis-trans isomerase SurA
MKKFSLPLVVLLLFIAPVFSQQSVPQESTSQDITSQDAATPQNDAAPQTDAQPASAPAAPLGAPASPEDKVIEEIVARVNNAIITRADLRRNLEQISFDTKEQNLTQSQIEERRANALRDLIDQQLLIQRAAELGITADADLVKRLDDIRKQMKVETLEELQKAAEKQGVHWEEFKQNTKNNILTQKVIGSEVGARIQVTHEEAQKYYDEHKTDFTQPERVRLSEILIANDARANKGVPLEGTPEQVAAAEAKAKEIYTQLKSGTSFDELARKESNGPTADQGGDLGYFKRNDLAKTLEDETFKLKAGEFTPVIHTRQGFIILQVSDHIEAGTPTFERVREQIHERVYMERVQPALREYLAKLRDDAYIDIKSGYTDTGAGANQSTLVYATDSGPRTKEVRGKLGMGKKKTVVVTGEESRGASAAGSTSALGQAKAEAEAREKAVSERNSAEEAAAAKAAAEAAEQEKLSHMSNNEKKRYLAQKKKREADEAKDEAKRKRKEEQKHKEVAAKEAQSQAAEAKAANAAETKAAAKKPAKENKSVKSKKPEKEPKEAESAQSSEQGETSQGKTSQQAESGEPPQKKKIHWF